MARTLDSTPKADGFRMPGEFEPHAQTWMLWPRRPDNWRLGAKPAQRAWVEVATAISRFEPVTVGVSGDQFGNARAQLPPQVRVVELASNDAWARDCGATFVVDAAGAVRAVDWRFNAWGGFFDGLYFPWDKDDAVAQKMAEIERVERYRAPIVLEGGAIHTDGEGTMLTTAECLLSPGRNPDLTKEQIEEQLREYTGIRKVIWLNRGLDPEETTGHVDVVVCFVRPGVVALAWTDDPSDWRHEVLAENLEILSAATDAQGRALEIHKIPLPAPMHATEDEVWSIDAVEGSVPRQAGDELPASYINYYVCNGGVIVPAFGDPNDAVARERLQALYPDREVVMLPVGREIELGGGNIHCITQQQPAPQTK
jgi:agmatine deiminase